MSRYFEIIQQDRTTHPKRHDLPLAVGGSERAHIRLPGLDEDVCYIGEDHGHLFLQPVSGSVDIFHNNERISASVWIKSGDVTRIGDQLIEYDISGDLVTITVQQAVPRTGRPPEGPEIPLTPPSAASRPLPRVSSKDRGRHGMPLWLKIALPLVAMLAGIAAFLLASVTFDIKISPIPDSVSFSGMPPVIELGGRYLALPGKYILHAEKQDYLPLQEEIDLRHDQRAFSFTLKLLPGKVDFTTEPEPGAEIRIDGVSLGITPITSAQVDAGRHTVQVRLKKYKPLDQEIKVEGRGRYQHFQFTLEPAWGTVEITSEPPGARVIVDGDQTEDLTPARLEIDEGEHEIVLQLENYRPASINVTVQAGERISIPGIKLVPAPAVLKITSTPVGAMIAIDGVYAGKTPLTHEVNSGQVHVITATAPGYSTGTRKVNLKPGVTDTINFKLTGRYGTVFITTEPASAELFIDGRPQKKNSGKFTLLAVPHTIEVRAKGRAPLTKKINTFPGSSQAVDFRLASPAVSAAKRGSVLKQGDLVLLQPGRFIMGSSRREQGRRTNEVRREIILTRPFYIGAREVTNRQFRMFRKEHSSGSFAGRSLNGDSQPVVNISWEEAARYCNWLSEKEGLEPFYIEEGGKLSAVSQQGTGYRLPTEAEWAWAARFAKRSEPAKYPWKGKFPPQDGSGNFADESARGLLPVIIEGYNDSFAVSSPPGSFRPNAAGVFDMGGNVAEWCHDYYSPTPVRGAEKDPMGPVKGTHHVVRDSSWQDSSMTQLRLAYRSFGKKPADYIGFRVARYAR